MKNWFFSLTRAKQIIVAVIACHGFVLLSLTCQHWISSVPPKRKHIAIKTVRLAPPVKQAAVVATAVAVKPTVAKKEVPKKTIAKKVAPKKEEKALLKEIEKALATVSEPVQTKRKEIELPVLTLEEAQVEFSPSEIIASFLQEMLQLPEYGAVKVELSLDRLGKLERLEILETKSEKNETFLRNQLPQLVFPCLNKAVTLTIVFSNDV